MPISARLPASARRCLHLLAGSVLLGGLLACGYKGPLYLPAPEAPPADLTTPPGQDAPPGSSVN